MKTKILILLISCMLMASAASAKRIYEYTNLGALADADEFLVSDASDSNREFAVTGAVLKTFIGSGSMTYPGAGISVSTGSAWGTSYSLTTLAAALDGEAWTFTGAVDLSGASSVLMGPLSFEGTTADDNETTFSITDPTADRTITVLNLNSTIPAATAVDASGNILISAGISLPGTCVVGALFIDTDADTNGQLYSCIATNTWKDVDDDGGAGGVATTDIDTSSELLNIVTNETGSASGTPLLVFNQNPTIAGAVLTGVIDAGGATSTEVVNGASPTVDAAGEVAIDTTSDQLIYYGGAKRSLTYKKQIDFAVKTPVDADDFFLFKAQTAITITDIHVITIGGTSIAVDIQECSSTGTSCATVDAAITADTDGAEDDGTLSNGAIDAGDWVKVVLAAPSGTVNYLAGSIYYVETAD